MVLVNLFKMEIEFKVGDKFKYKNNIEVYEIIKIEPRKILEIISDTNPMLIYCINNTNIINNIIYDDLIYLINFEKNGWRKYKQLI